jgi:formate C-acetyltransferase
MIVETMGIVNLADSLFTIQKLVFEQKKYTLRELTDALKNNFSDASDLLNDIANLPKFGQNSGEPEAIMQQLTADVAAIAEQFSGDGFFCIPSLHTLHQHISYGYRLNATADGRLAQEPLAKNAGVRPEVHTDHTSLILAVSSWEQARFSGGQPLDLWIAVHELQKQENLERYAVLLQTYLARGGLQLQLNGVDPEDLRAAREHPEKYGHLIVRIGGFSMRFVELGSNAQNDFIRRFSSGM